MTDFGILKNFYLTRDKDEKPKEDIFHISYISLLSYVVGQHGKLISCLWLHGRIN